MAAAVEVHRFTGTSPGTGTDITSSKTYFTTSDNHYSASPNYPVPVPAAASNYSYWLSLRLKCTAAPDTALNNAKFYMNADWTGGTGITFLGQKANAGADAGYRQATGTPGDTGIELTAGNHTGLTGGPVDPFAWTDESPASLAGSTSTTGYFCDFVVLQAVVAAAAVGAAQPDFGFTFYWDET